MLDLCLTFSFSEDAVPVLLGYSCGHAFSSSYSCSPSSLRSSLLYHDMIMHLTHLYVATTTSRLVYCYCIWSYQRQRLWLWINYCLNWSPAVGPLQSVFGWGSVWLFLMRCTFTGTALIGSKIKDELFPSDEGYYAEVELEALLENYIN